MLTYYMRIIAETILTLDGLHAASYHSIMMKYSPSQLKSVHELFGLGLQVKMLADKHFPRDCPERFLLLEIDNAFSILWNFHFSLQQTQDKIELVRSRIVPTDREIIELALTYEKLAEKHPSELETGKTFKRTGEILHIWYRLYLDLEQLLEVSAALRFGLERPDGSA